MIIGEVASALKPKIRCTDFCRKNRIEYEITDSEFQYSVNFKYFMTMHDASLSE